MVKAVSAKPRNCTAVSKIDPLRAPVCRKGMLVGDVSVNWKALCQVCSTVCIFLSLRRVFESFESALNETS